jgi:hypothetical protein
VFSRSGGRRAPQREVRSEARRRHHFPHKCQPIELPPGQPCTGNGGSVRSSTLRDGARRYIAPLRREKLRSKAADHFAELLERPRGREKVPEFAKDGELTRPSPKSIESGAKLLSVASCVGHVSDDDGGGRHDSGTSWDRGDGEANKALSPSNRVDARSTGSSVVRRSPSEGDDSALSERGGTMSPSSGKYRRRAPFRLRLVGLCSRGSRRHMRRDRPVVRHRARPR